MPKADGAATPKTPTSPDLKARIAELENTIERWGLEHPQGRAALKELVELEAKTTAKPTPPEWATLEPNCTRIFKESVGNLERSLKNKGITQPSPDHVGHHVIPGTVYRDVPLLKEIGFRIDHYPNGYWVERVYHTGRHQAYTDAMTKILSEIPMPTDAVSRAIAAQRVGTVMDAAKSVMSEKKLPLRYEDARAVNPKLTHEEFTTQWENAIRSKMN